MTTTEPLIGDASNANAAAPSQSAPQPAVASAAPAVVPQQQLPASSAPATANAPPAPANAPAASAPVERSAPEKYEFKFADDKAKVDPAILGAFEATARELKMPQEEAQKMVEALAPKIKAQVAVQQAQAVSQASALWEASARSDPEFGGDKLAENLALGEKFLATFATPQLRQLLLDSKLGNHPEVIRLAVRAGKALSEDKFVAGRTAPPQKSELETMYPTMFKG